MVQKKICFAASSGGHFEQILMLKPLMEKYDSFLITEKPLYKVEEKNKKIYYLHQINRKEWKSFILVILNCIYSLIIFVKERPNVVITTGALAVIPMCLIIKIFRGKLIFIESFAKVSSPTKTGELMYKFADQFYVQWPQMLKFYPSAIYLGGIY